MTSARPTALAAGGSRRRRRPGMSWTTRTARAPFAHSSRRLTADMSGRAPAAAVAPSPGSNPLGLAFGALDLGGLDVMSVGLGEKLLLAPRAGFGDDVLESFHLLGGEPAPFLEDPHARHGGLDGQRANDSGEERHDQRGAKPEKKGRRMDLHATLLIWRGRYSGGAGVFVTFLLRPFPRDAPCDSLRELKELHGAWSERLTHRRCAPTMSLSHEVEGGSQPCPNQRGCPSTDACPTRFARRSRALKRCRSAWCTPSPRRWSPRFAVFRRSAPRSERPR